MKSADFEDGIFSFKEKEMDWTDYIHCLEAEHSTKSIPKIFWDAFFIYFFSRPIVNPK